MPGRFFLRSRLALVALVVFAAFALARTALAQQTAPRTRTERTNYTETSHHADVLAFLDALDRAAPGKLARRTIGTTSEGREIPLVVASRPLVRTPAEARATGKPIVYVQGNIHGGEVEGKEALQALLRNLVLAPGANALDSIVLLAVPIYNGDGNDSWGPQARQRGSQNGPETIGLRPNGQGFDLNRDYMKAEAPETRASLAAFDEWDPDVFVDLHTTNGSYHGYALTYSPSLNPAAYLPGLAAGPLTRDELLPELRRRMSDRHDFAIFDYGNFPGNDPVPAGWFTYDHRARYGTNYQGLLGRVTILSEAYSHDPFERRVRSTYAFVQELLSLTAERAADIVAAVRDAGSAVGALQANRTPVPLRAARPDSLPTGPIVYEVLQRTDDTTRVEPGVRRGFRRTGEYRTVTVPIQVRFTGTSAQPMPWGWAFTADSLADQWLARHHVEVETVGASSCTAPSVRTFTPDSVSVSGREYQGRREAYVSGSWGAPASRPLAAGTRVVRASQRAGLVAMLSLEPTSDDGLTAWNEGGRVAVDASGEAVAHLLPIRLEAPLPECALRPMPTRPE
jgi:hypothetical protein